MHADGRGGAGEDGKFDPRDAINPDGLTGTENDGRKIGGDASHDFARSMSWEEPGTCGLCHGGPPGKSDRDKGDAKVGPLCWVALAQRSNVPGVARRRVIPQP